MTKADDTSIQAASPLVAGVVSSCTFFIASAGVGGADGASPAFGSSARTVPKLHRRRAIASKGEDRVRTISGSPYEWGSEARRPRAATHGRVQGSAQVGGSESKSCAA